MSSAPKLLLFLPAETGFELFSSSQTLLQPSGHCHDKPSSADIPSKAALLFFKFSYLYFPFFLPPPCQPQKAPCIACTVSPSLPTGVSAYPKILTVLLVGVLVHYSGPGFTSFACFSSVCIQFWSPHHRVKENGSRFRGRQ